MKPATQRQIVKYILWLFVLSFSPLNLIAASGVQTRLPADIPGSVQQLLEWPTPETIAAKSVPANALNARKAVFNAEVWLRKVVDSNWLPATLDPICIHGEFEGRDVIRYQWVKGNRQFMVSQTGSIFVLQVRPELGALRSDSNSDLLQSARRLAKEVLAKTGRRRTGQGEEVPVAGLDSQIVDSSFDSERVKEVATPGQPGLRLLGRPRTMKEEGVLQPNDEIAAKVQDAPSNEQWKNSALAWQYWFRNVYWFADGERLVLYFLKQEGGPIRLSFAGSADNSWFQ